MSVLTPPPVQPPDHPGEQYVFPQPPGYPPPQPNAVQAWFKNLSHQARIALAVAVALVAVVIIVISVSASSSSLPYSPRQIVNELIGTTANDGTTVTSVIVVGQPIDTNGIEIAAVNLT